MFFKRTKLASEVANSSLSVGTQLLLVRVTFFVDTEVEIGNASGTDGSVQPHGKAILIKLKSKLYKLYWLKNSI